MISSESLWRNFDMNRPAALNARSTSKEVCGMVEVALKTFSEHQKYQIRDKFLEEQNRLGDFQQQARRPYLKDEHKAYDANPVYW